MDPSCVFCRIVSGESPASILHRDELVTAFLDRHPIASTHILVVPNRHIPSVNEAGESDAALLGHMILVARQIAFQQGVAEKGYRLLMNTGRGSGQSVFHLHLHLIAGRGTRFILG